MSLHEDGPGDHVFYQAAEEGEGMIGDEAEPVGEVFLPVRLVPLVLMKEAPISYEGKNGDCECLLEQNCVPFPSE